MLNYNRDLVIKDYVRFAFLIVQTVFSMDILFLPLIQEGLLSVTSESMSTDYWLTAKSKLAQGKIVWLG